MDPRRFVVFPVLTSLLCWTSSFLWPERNPEHDPPSSDWSTNVPGYILGLARGDGGGRSAVGLGWHGSQTDTNFVFLASDCAEIEWTAHDGESFGKERVVGGDLVERQISWIQQAESVHVFVDGVEDFIGLMAIEGMTNISLVDGQILFKDPNDGSEWTLSSNIPVTGFIDIRPEFPGDDAWVNPGQIASAVYGNSSPVYFRHVQEMSLVFFKNFKVGRNSWTLALQRVPREEKVDFPHAAFARRHFAWQSELGEWTVRGMSNLLGNVGRFAGDLALTELDEPFLRLTSMTPSRTKFPRGFLWDEGFHLLAISGHSEGIAMEIFFSWLSIQRPSGWIPRELALSPRDRAAIPKEFLAQSPEVANPTTLVFVARKWLRTGRLSTSALQQMLSALSSWFHHLTESQASATPNCFRWKNRTDRHCLASGLDDFPRGTIVRPTECHLDLHAWLLLLLGTISEVCTHLGCREGEQFLRLYREMHANLRSVFLASKLGLLADFTGIPNQHSPHIGYVTLTPFVLGQLCPFSDSLLIERLLGVVEDELLGPFGVMSLSRADPNFQTEEAYWRGNVWANFNLLLVGALEGYAKYFSNIPETPSALILRMQGLADTVRSRWLAAAKTAWTQSGGPREYLTPLGEGGGVKSFAGWTAAAMVLLESRADFWTEAVGVSTVCRG